MPSRAKKDSNKEDEEDRAGNLAGDRERSRADIATREEGEEGEEEEEGEKEEKGKEEDNNRAIVIS